MKFGILSDIHGYPPLEEDRKELYTCDVVCLCGDVFEGRLLEDFANDQIIDWMKSLTDLGKRVIMTPGNHDLMLYRGWLEKNNLPLDLYCRHILRAYPLTAEELKEKCGCDVLIDEGTEVNGIKIWGTPNSNRFCQWAWMFEDDDLYEKFSKIPKETKIVLSHTPPRKEDLKWNIDISDYDRTVHCGSRELTQAIEENLDSAIIFCGHIHSGNHNTNDFTIVPNNRVINVSYVNENYKPYYKPYYFEIGMENVNM